METLSKLVISHLKNGYQYFQGDYPEFRCEPVGEDDNYRYYQIHHKLDQTERLLFYPVKIGSTSSNTPINRCPTSLSLEQLLTYINREGLFSCGNFDQIIIPIGESTPIPILKTYEHMVTLVLDLATYTNVPEQIDSEIVKPSANVRIIDSLGICVPFCHQTSEIRKLLQKYLNIIHFEREYLSHQSIIDLSSCCYFTLKTIHYLLTHPIKTYKYTSLLNLIPKPNTWIGTSYNWLTESDRTSIQDLILSVYQSQQLSDYEISQLQKHIIECGEHPLI